MLETADIDVPEFVVPCLLLRPVGSILALVGDVAASCAAVSTGVVSALRDGTVSRSDFRDSAA